MRILNRLCALLILPWLAMSCTAESFEAGVDYEVLSQAVPTSTGDKVEMTEVFWYGCGHCYAFEPALKQWKKSLPEGVEFVRSPAMWNAPMKVHAQMFYTAQALKLEDKLHDKMFEALNVKRQRLADADEIYPLFEAEGIDRATFDKTWGSFKVTSDVRRADSRARAYHITGTPELVINGKYRISSRMTGSQAKMLEVARQLIDQELAAKAQ